LAWEKATDRERDSKFVELGRYLCEVGQDNTGGWTTSYRLTVPGEEVSRVRRKAYYLMAIPRTLDTNPQTGTN